MRHTCTNPSCRRVVSEYLREGLCNACATYQYRFGRARPYSTDGRSERYGLKPIAHPEDFDTGIRIGRVVGMGAI